jgi:small subunit ribosomal protein S17
MSNEAKETMSIERGERKVREGIVVSNKMDKTIVVTVEDRFKHKMRPTTVVLAIACL